MPAAVEKAYRKAKGPKAFARQTQARAARFMCCGEARATGHHLNCSRRPKRLRDPATMDVQQTLL